MSPMMPMHMRGFMFHGALPVELIYSVIVAFSCFLIYIVTKEVYQLSAHKGIRYFRNAFLFFGIAFGLRLLLPLLVSVMAIRHYEIRDITGFLMVYTGTVAVLYVLFSVLWKRLRLKDSIEVAIIHGSAILIAGFTLVTYSRYSILLVQALLFLVAGVFSYIDYRKHPKRKQQTQWLILYLLLFGAWLANLLATFTVSVSLGFTYLLYLISAALFVTILLRVLRRTHSHRK